MIFTGYTEYAEQCIRHLFWFPQEPRNLGRSSILFRKVPTTESLLLSRMGNLRALFKECELSEEAVTPAFLCESARSNRPEYREALQPHNLRKCTVY